ncbi:MAG: heme lyase CcmF/NrfE family subunit [Methylomonas sp.]|nr:heme lyase CcmF/NrfE family subunit [Methylomonas sp.]PPD22904.1 MAG: c-type cytochrome biogenesis protein CcmF [Methylomonas sp.]PPD27374.1 MAG: c-type cytochrome biogenesis protein CcmF [Methylomonas sp.]PPD39350.1 MAG: c-type cytochrome biogenesis protein CcmF [Methylomonas sp.]PPD41973.1 MAG: c-type cytochrome biogenesis protein CcmF [Methylomonas sp.]
MIPELGHFALILALCMALVQGTLPFVGASRRIVGWIAIARASAYGQLLFMATAYACLTYSFIVHDFSVAYVAQNSNTALPLLYLVSGVWGAHEGSLLLWALTLSIWIGLVAAFSQAIPDTTRARVLGVMGLVSVGFILFLLMTSNPFARLFPAPAQGRDLNPLLQDPGLAIHPPMLYMGYVGFSVAFAFSITALLEGRLDSAWARWSRPWTSIAWMFLTLGITLGSWWAYYELGWGGWWFWDPVENASFMPWLVGTALIHSLAATEKRGVFKTWTVLLAIFAFSLSLLGTFLVRSGVLTSVHAFASDPTRGVFILVFLALVVGGSLLLYAVRAPEVKSSASFDWVSRESVLLVNNVLLVATAASILLGTLYPLIIDALGMGKLSVGPPYFNAVFVPLMAPLTVAVGFGVLLRWKRDDINRLNPVLLAAGMASLALACLLPLLMPFYSVAAALGLLLALWTLGISGYAFVQRLPGFSLAQLRQIPAGFYGMTLAHVGMAVFVVGVTFTSVYSLERDVRLAPGESVELFGYVFTFYGVNHNQGPNYVADQGHLTVSRGDGEVAELAPQKRVYRVQSMPMTEAAIDVGLFRDLFVALGEPLGGDGAWSVRVHYKAFIRWIWLGGVLMALGGLLGALDRRYRLMNKTR